MFFLRRSFFLSLPLFVATLLPITSAQAADSLTDTQKTEIRAIVKDYLVNDPDLLQEAIEALQKRVQEQQQNKLEVALKQQMSALITSMTPVLGNPTGDLTIIEFTDYQCGYCRAVESELNTFVKNDGKVRLIRREFPILGPLSVTAAQAALAASMQGKYPEMHERMMSTPDALTEEDIYRIAGEIGLDINRLKTDMNSEAVTSEIGRVREIAQKLSIRGTPAFVIGNHLYPGALDIDGFKTAASRARATAAVPTKP